jgi:hypothetical protein
VIQIRLGLFQTLEALALQRRLLRMADSGLDLAFGKSHQMQIVWEPPQADFASLIPSIRYVARSTNW